MARLPLASPSWRSPAGGPIGLALCASLSLFGCKEEADKGFVGGGGSLNTEDSGAADGADGTDGADGADGGDDGVPVDTNIELPPTPEACTTGEEGAVETQPALRLTAVATWTIEFDAEAEASGFFDCSYTRRFEGLQTLEHDFTCPDCDVLITRGDATVTEGLDCVEQITGTAEELRPEMWGATSDGRLFRVGRDQSPLSELATFTPPSVEGESVAIEWSSTSDLTDGGTMLLSAMGEMSWAADPETLLDEPFGPRPAAYACGWECNDPGTHAQDYALDIGSTMPNVRLDDQCGDAVDLWDFTGSYLIIDNAEPDCGPCRSMASESEAFLARMREAGIPVRAITILGNGLGEPWVTPDAEVVDEWVSSSGGADPVLADNGYGWSLFPSFFETATGESFGYPAWILVDPEMKIIKANIGYSSWEPMEEAILDDLSGG